MGNAFHRKQIPISRGTKTRGTGIGYWNKTAQTFTGGDNVREWNKQCLITLAARSLDAWETEHLNDYGEIITGTAKTETLPPRRLWIRQCLSSTRL
jgi:hypothetical protein